MARWAGRRWWLALTLIVLVGLAVRLVYLFGWFHPATIQGDPFYYHHAANLFVDGRGWPDPYELALNNRYVPDAQHPPLTSALLAIPSLFGQRSFVDHQVFSCLLGALAVACVGLTGRRVAGPGTGLVAAGIAAVYPGMWINDPLLMSETTGILTTSLVLWLAYRFWDRRGYLDAVLLGLAAAAAALARAELALLTVFLVTPLILMVKSASWRRRFGMLVAAGAACVVAIAPWTIYNFTRFSEPEILSSGLGTTLAVTHCDSTYSGERLGWWDFQCILALPEPPLERSERDVFYREFAYDYIGAHKGELVKVAAARAGRTWGVFRPFQQVQYDTIEQRPVWASRAGLFSLWALMAAGVAGAVLLRRRRALLLPLLALPGALTLASTMVYGTSRFRAVAEPAVVLLAAVAITAGLVALTRRVGGGHRPGRGAHRAPRRGLLGARPHPVAATGAGPADQDLGQAERTEVVTAPVGGVASGGGAAPSPA